MNEISCLTEDYLGQKETIERQLQGVPQDFGKTSASTVDERAKSGKSRKEMPEGQQQSVRRTKAAAQKDRNLPICAEALRRGDNVTNEALQSELSRLSRRPLRVLSNQFMPASAPATPATSKPAKVTAKPNKDTSTHPKKHNQDANNPSTSANSSKPTIHRQKAASLRIAQALAMFDSFDRNYHNTYCQNITDIQHSLVERIDSLVNSLAALAPGAPSSSDRDDAVRLEQRREANRSLNAHLVCLQSASCAARDIAAQQAAVAFEAIKKHRPQEVKVKRGKATKKERKEKEAPSSSKAERSSHREKPSSKAHAHAANQVDPTPETPVTTNHRVTNKRRAAQTPTSAPPPEKKPKKENGVKKRTSNRLSKTPRVKAKEEDEPTYCFCSRISFGEMIGCDNDKCEIEWFHFECIGLTTKPKGKWFCPNCRHPDSARMPKAGRVINTNNRNAAAVEKV
ncbi:hypothetical protein Y032_0053g2353 [Ancylostoma ceylanicum]|uniref:PHD-type domain-containing protein n=2 Tax=Ancylostoma ceylanicum TaxID=53326 RepID=A0A016U6S8_9BILA|nr:hypothetical protein Y032_0053g2353 [Ancylostoma ceylanicum]